MFGSILSILQGLLLVYLAVASREVSIANVIMFSVGGFFVVVGFLHAVGASGDVLVQAGLTFVAASMGTGSLWCLKRSRDKRRDEARQELLNRLKELDDPW